MINLRIFSRASQGNDTTLRSKGSFGLASMSAVSVLLLGLILRLRYAFLAGFHADEYATVHAAQMIAERGVPLLRSGVFYAHGLMISYLTVPFLPLSTYLPGYMELVWRLPSIILSGLTIVVLYKIGNRMFAPGVGLLAAFVFAVYTEFIPWGSRARPYALLQLLTLLTVFFLYQAISNRDLLYSILFGLCFTLGMLTHLETALLLPAMFIGSMIFGGVRWPFSRGGICGFALCLLGLFLPSALEILGSAQMDPRDSAMGFLEALQIFIGWSDPARLHWYGKYLLSPMRMIWIIPFSCATLTTIFSATYDGLTDRDNCRWSLGHEVVRKVGFWAFIYIGVMVMFISMVSWGPGERFLLFSIPLAVVPGAWIVWYGARTLLRSLYFSSLARTWRECGNSVFGMVALGVLALAWPFTVGSVLNVWDVWNSIPLEPAYTAAFKHVARRVEDTDVVMSVSVASSVYLGRLDYFPLEIGYDYAVVRNESGNQVHVLTGAPWVGTTDEFAQVLRDNAVVWFVVDDYRFKSRYRPETKELVNQNMILVYSFRRIRVYLYQNPRVHEISHLVYEAH